MVRVTRAASRPGAHDAAHTWLESPNSFLEGARPLDVLRLRGPAPVLEALDAEAWGGAT